MCRRLRLQAEALLVPSAGFAYLKTFPFLRRSNFLGFNFKNTTIVTLSRSGILRGTIRFSLVFSRLTVLLFSLFTLC